MARKPEYYADRDDTKADRFKKFLGTTFITALCDEVVLKIGKDRYTRYMLANKIGITNVGSARQLTRFAERHMYRSVFDMYNKTSPYSFADTNIGVTGLYVMFRLFEAQGLSVEQWYGRKMDDTVTSFLYFKKREADARRRTKRRR